MATQIRPLTLEMPGSAPRQAVMQKDTVPTPAMTAGLLYSDGGPWSMCTDEVISDVVPGGSMLMRWLPTRGVDSLTSHVAHIAWVGPQGFTGSNTYMQYLQTLSAAGECGYGPSDDWNAFEYAHSGAPFSRKSPTLKPINFGQTKYCDKQPIMRVRGNNAGVNLTNDAEWAIARAGMGLANHLDWNLVYGDQAMGPFMYDGLDVIIQPGWVSSKLIGASPAVFSDPLVANGVTLNTPEKLLNMIKGMVRKLRVRASQRGYQLTPNDQAIVMSSSHWQAISNFIALGYLMPMADVPAAAQVQISAEAFQREKSRITTGFLGFGFIPVDNQPVPVLIEDLLATNVTATGNIPSVTGDIYVLTRYFNGITILEHQFQNWNAMQGYPTNGTEMIMQNGLLRAGWVTEANKCFYYYVEGQARILSTMQPLQGRINDVTVSTLLLNENESGNPGSQDWYAFDGRRGGAGTALVNGYLS